MMILEMVYGVFQMNTIDIAVCGRFWRLKRDQQLVLPTEEAQNEESSVVDLEAALKVWMYIIVHHSVAYDQCEQKLIWTFTDLLQSNCEVQKNRKRRVRTEQ